MDNIYVAFILLAVGFALLIKGADFFVDGASNIARYLGISTLVIGLTVVAFGTSLPEAAVSISGAIQNVDDVSLGNVVGSNIANLLLILGLSSVVSPIIIDKDIIKRDLPISILAALLLIPMMYFLHDGTTMSITRIEGVILLVVFIAFMVLVFKSALGNKNKINASLNKEDITIESEVLAPSMSKAKAITLTLLGIVGIVGGGILTTNSAKTIAIYFGMSELLIGLTVVSLGTSLPELITSMVAAFKKENDIAVGNVVGSNIFNILFVIGISTLILPISINPVVIFDLLFLIVTSVIVLILCLREKKLGRVEGIFMSLFYVGYLSYIIYRDVIAK